MSACECHLSKFERRLRFLGRPGGKVYMYHHQAFSWARDMPYLFSIGRLDWICGWEFASKRVCIIDVEQ